MTATPRRKTGAADTPTAASTSTAAGSATARDGHPHRLDDGDRVLDGGCGSGHVIRGGRLRSTSGRGPVRVPGRGIKARVWVGALLVLVVSALIAGVVLSLIAFVLLQIVVSPRTHGATTGSGGGSAQIAGVATVGYRETEASQAIGERLGRIRFVGPPLIDSTTTPISGGMRTIHAATALVRRSPAPETAPIVWTSSARPPSPATPLTLSPAAGVRVVPAQGGPAPGGDGTAALVTVLNNLRNWIVRILASVATVFLTVAGLRYLTAGGDPGEVAAAKAALKSAFIGYGLAALAPALVAILRQIVGV